ncbi:dihydrofolate reductase family protein [Streptomyces sp. NPDC059649]|uniref:dihydrofolate reductase family protein n=1 Tax=Streptomyces sp. NPDC059649 TaxID=3346895 RepID=UPI0036A903B7
MRKLTYFVATTIDGFIAAPDGDFGFFLRYVTKDFLSYLVSEWPETLPAPGRTALGIGDAPNARFDTVLMGRGTYDVGLPDGLTSPYPHLRQIVLSRSMAETPDSAVEVVAEDPLTLVRGLKQEEGLDIWLCGGADIAGQLLSEIDELVVKQYPVLAGSGMPLFRTEFAPHHLTLADHRVFEGGNLVLTYTKSPA